ncbi:DNA starvation/stationary phase protection protein Dps [Stieleria varia]|uniref:Fine tangled pili major subunit n=1 Tax=Stieleria varia TaxID=2528005 RepID=A0A5C6B9N0_9BACT|nr:DNA starvation/stationary phase protection protein Dps [Stieleria varia]TWU08427.1 Fine tangled pili major subunit [Stieleria varia]
MTTATKTASVFKRQILTSDANQETVSLLQANLVNLVDLALLLKQAHWNVLGTNFRSVHLQLDEIIASVRNASDEVAERVSTLGVAPDGRSETVAKDTDLSTYPDGFQKVPATLQHVADALMTTIEQIRDAIEKLGEMDPISEDLLIGISATLEKHLWMVQAQEE